MKLLAPVRPSIHHVKTGKRGISTPLISVVLPAAAPFQTSCALLASLFKKMAHVADSNCYTSLLGAAFTIHHGSTRAIQKRMWHLSIRLRRAGSCHFPFSFKRMTRATDSNCYPYFSAAAFTIHQQFYPCHPQSS